VSAQPRTIPGDEDAHRAHGWRTIRHFAYVDRDFRAVRRCLAADPESFLAAAPGGPGGDTTAKAELHVDRAGFDLTRHVRMTLGDLRVGVNSAHLPIRWEDATRPGLFPILDATLEVTAVKAGRRAMTQLGLFGRYRPPFGRLGALTDNLAGHRIVVESVDWFLDQLVERLHTTLPEPSPDEVSDADLVSPERPGRRRIILGVGPLDRSPGGAAGLALRLQTAAGVLDASVNPRTGLAEIDYDNQVCSPGQLLQLLEDEP
jgi:hypothetical protein